MRRSDHDVTDTVRTTDPAAVGAEVIRLGKRLFPNAPAPALERAFTDAARMYRGEHRDYRPCDTEYHDIQHVLEVTLATSRLMDGYQRGGHNGSPPLSKELFLVGVLAALFHDFGYLRRRSDHKHRYGAEYTLTHAAMRASSASTSASPRRPRRWSTSPATSARSRASAWATRRCGA
jgi:hypothetical protein